MTLRYHSSNAELLRIAAMHPTAITTNHQTNHQRRLKAIVQRLVIELGYLEYCLTEGRQDTHLETAAASIDTAIDCLNDHLSD